MSAFTAAQRTAQQMSGARGAARLSRGVRPNLTAIVNTWGGEMASQNVVDAVAEIGSDAYRELAKLRKRVQQLEAAEEGAKEAFSVVANDLSESRAECSRLRGLLDDCHAQIRRQAALLASKA